MKWSRSSTGPEKPGIYDSLVFRGSTKVSEIKDFDTFGNRAAGHEDARENEIKEKVYPV
jgi:hypothetical protein